MFEFTDRVPGDLRKYEELLRDLHRGVLIKTLIEIAHGDRQWSRPEKEVAVMVMQHNLPIANISFHAVFEGNPGTGKTTVARILARLLCGLEILDRGQTVEVDRSGLVAQYAGQTGPRTNERIDEALGGVLFIDEAYSLMSDQGDDTFGTEAVQTLLKRMEDDRDQFVVVLAGYPDPMRRMLRSNPGLSSHPAYVDSHCWHRTRDA
jgi:hypothetical protein